MHGPGCRANRLRGRHWVLQFGTQAAGRVRRDSSLAEPSGKQERAPVRQDGDVRWQKRELLRRRAPAITDVETLLTPTIRNMCRFRQISFLAQVPAGRVQNISFWAVGALVCSGTLIHPWIVYHNRLCRGPGQLS